MYIFFIFNIRILRDNQDTYLLQSPFCRRGNRFRLCVCSESQIYVVELELLCLRIRYNFIQQFYLSCLSYYLLFSYCSKKVNVKAWTHWLMMVSGTVRSILEEGGELYMMHSVFVWSRLYRYTQKVTWKQFFKLEQFLVCPHLTYSLRLS